MKKLLSGIILVILLSSPALGDRTIVSELDGSDWQGWAETKKFNFLSGFLLGSSYIIKKNEPFIPKGYRDSQFDDLRKRLSLKNDDRKRKPSPTTFSKEEMILWGHYRASMIQNGLIDYGIYEITASQLSKGIDDLYRNAKNIKIKIADALYIVKKQITGASQEEIEKALLYLRGD